MGRRKIIITTTKCDRCGKTYPETKNINGKFYCIMCRDEIRDKSKDINIMHETEKMIKQHKTKQQYIKTIQKRNKNPLKRLKRLEEYRNKHKNWGITKKHQNSFLVTVPGTDTGKTTTKTHKTFEKAIEWRNKIWQETIQKIKENA